MIGIENGDLVVRYLQHGTGAVL